MSHDPQGDRPKMLRMRHARPSWSRRERELRPARERDWSGAKAVLVAVIVLATALGLAGYAAAASYMSVRGLAHKHHLPLWQVYPLSVDGGLIGVTIINLALLAIGQPLWWLRWIARLFALGTVAANAAAGWPDPVGIMLRIWPSVLFVVVVEASQAVLMRHLKRKRKASEPARKKERDRIPLARWLLAFRSTWALWKRMKLWRIRSYSVAIRTELSRRQAEVRLAGHYAPCDWRLNAPKDLVWMLTTGVRIDEALAGVTQLIGDTGKVEAAEQAAREAAGHVQELEQEVARLGDELVTANTALEAERAKRVRGRNSGRSSGRKRTASSPQNGRASSPVNDGAGSPHETETADDLSLQAAALEILAAKPDISGSQLGLRLGKTKRYGCILKNKLAPVGAEPAGGERTEGDVQ
jgi:hypothetical protein